MVTQFPISDSPTVSGLSDPQNSSWRPDLLPADQISHMRAIEERFCGSIGPVLTAYFQNPVRVRRTETAPCTMAEFLKPRRGDDACLVSLDLAPFQGRGHARFSQGFVVPALETLLGAGSDIPLAANRSLTNIDLHILRDVFELLFQEIRIAWAPLYECAFRVETVQSAGESAASAAPESRAYESAFEIAFQQYTGTFRLAVPSLLIRLALESHTPIPGAQAITAGPERKFLLRSLENVQVTVQAVLRGSELTFGDLLELKPGQVIVFPHPAGTVLHCDVNEKPKFTGELVNVGGGMAFQVQACLPAADESREVQSR